MSGRPPAGYRRGGGLPAPVAGFRSWGVARAGVAWDERIAARQPGPGRPPVTGGWLPTGP
jgi:hypothetical protein